VSLRRLIAAAVFASAAVVVPAASAAPTATISGRVLDAAGAPVRGAEVEFEADPEGGFFGFFRCLVPIGDECWWHDTSVRTDANGRYAIKVRTDTYLGRTGERDVNVTQPGAAVPARTTLRFAWQAKSVRLPDLRLWTPDVSVDPALPAVRTVRVPPLPAEYGTVPLGAFPVADLLRRGDGAAWSYGAVPVVRPADARTVEAGTTHIVATQAARLDGYRVWYHSPGRPVTGGVRPLSRGKSCYAYGKGGKLLRLAGCQYTDGVFAKDPDLRYDLAGYQACLSCPERDRVLIDLGSVQTVGAVALRGCWTSDSVAGVSVSSDGKTYQALREVPTLTDRDLRVYVPAQARYVRVDLGFGCRTHIQELSVFAPLAV
jgi:hypothetical protein